MAMRPEHSGAIPPTGGSMAPRPGAVHGARARFNPGAAGGSPGRWNERLKSHRYLILLLVLVCVLIVQSVDRRLVGVTAIAELLVMISLAAMVLVVFEGRRGRLAALWSGVVVAALGGARYLLPAVSHPGLEVLQQVLLMCFHGWAAALILRDVFQQERIRTDDVLGAVSGYLLAAAAWANLYAVFEILFPGSFTISPDLTAQFSDLRGRLALLTYFSLATITSVGYGDIAPARGPMTAFAMLETVFGQFYIAVVVAQLVGMRLAQGTRGKGGR